MLDFRTVNLGVFYMTFTACVACKLTSKSNWFSNFLDLIFRNWTKIEWHSIFQKSSGDKKGVWQFTWIITKGHLISEWTFWAFKSPKKSTNFLTNLCPSFMGQKSDKNLVGFLGDLKTPKLHSEINWPLVALGQKSMFLLFFSVFSSLCLVMAPDYSHFYFDPFCYFIF